jgi:hypothetical protein
MHPEQAIAALRFVPLVPVWVIVTLAVLCVAALVPALLRRARGALLRMACFAVLLLWLAGPRLVQETRQTLPDIGVLLVDRTASMQVGDRSKLAEAARVAIEGQAAHLPDLELRTVTVPPGGSGTQLFAALDRALSDIPPARLAGVVAITDGQVHDVPASMPAGAPLQVLIPARAEETDRRLRVVEAPSYGLVGHSVTLVVAIDDLGVAHPAGSARLTIRRDGEPPEVESVPIGQEHAIEVPITRAGPTVIDLAAEALPGEASPINNRAVVEINGVRDRLRVLLISGEPHPGERTWRRLLKADPSVDLVHFTILRPPEKDDLTPLNELALIAFPVRELFQVKIREFDLIILDRFQNRGLLPMPYLRNIADYVREGGSLLLSVGPEFSGPSSLALTPLGSVLPARPVLDGNDAVVDGQFRPQVTRLGERHPVTEGLTGANDPAKPGSRPTWGPWYRRIEATNVRGDVLMTSEDGEPLLVLDRVGRGRTALLLSDQIWLWSRGHLGGGPQAELLRRIAHWTMQEPELEENSLTARVEDGTLRIDRRATDEKPLAAVTVTDPDGHAAPAKLTQAGPGRATAAMPAGLPGVWQVSDGSRTTYAASTAADPLEVADLRATGTILAKLVHATGGSVHWLADSRGALAVPAVVRTEAGHQSAGADWIGLQRRHDHLVTGIAALALLPAWASLPLMLGLAIAAWRREGR